MPALTSSWARPESPARSKRCSARPTSPSGRTAPSTSATGSTQRVGGHQDLDETLSGAIYRIAPKGFASKPPAFDPATIDGAITALRSPAVNVRAIGFAALKARGAAAVNPVAALLKDPNPFIRGRAIFLLYQLGPEGIKRAGAPESYAEPAMRIAAYRAMRRADLDVHAGGGEARARQGSGRPPRGGAFAARRSRRPRRWIFWSRSRAAMTVRIAATSKRSALGPRAKSRRSTTGCAQTSA